MPCKHQVARKGLFTSPYPILRRTDPLLRGTLASICDAGIQKDNCFNSSNNNNNNNNHER